MLNDLASFESVRPFIALGAAFMAQWKIDHADCGNVDVVLDGFLCVWCDIWLAGTLCFANFSLADFGGGIFCQYFYMELQDARDRMSPNAARLFIKMRMIATKCRVSLARISSGSSLERWSEQ